MGFLKNESINFYCLYVLTYSRLRVDLVCDCLERENVFFSNLPYSRPPLPDIEPRKKQRGAVGCKCTLTFHLLPAGVTVDASASWMLRSWHGDVYIKHTFAFSSFRGSYLRTPPPSPHSAQHFWLPPFLHFDPTTFSHNLLAPCVKLEPVASARHILYVTGRKMCP